MYLTLMQHLTVKYTFIEIPDQNSKCKYTINKL